MQKEVVMELKGIKNEKFIMPIFSRKTMLARKAKRDKWFKALSLIGFFLIWQGISMQNIEQEWFNPIFLPSPTMILATAYQYIEKGTLFKHIGISFYRMITGFVIGTFVAGSVGILMTHFKWVDNLLAPIINLFGPIPVLAFLPMFLIWFGIGENSKITLISYTVFISMLPYIIGGIKNTDPLLIRSAISLGATKMQVFTKIIFNSALPTLFAGMKASLGLAFSSLVVAEMMGASSGLGFIIVDAKNWFKMSDMFLAAILIGIEYTLFYGIFTVIESVLFKWQADGVNSAVES